MSVENSKTYLTTSMGSVLKDALADFIVTHALFFTYQFDPVFFENHIIHQLIKDQLSPDEKVRLAQLEKILPEMKGKISVYYDLNGLTRTEYLSSLDYEKIPILHDKGVFHPKMVLLLTESEEDHSQGLFCFIGSGNLTRTGWWQNLEIGWCRHFSIEDSIPFKSELLSFLSRVRKFPGTQFDKTKKSDHENLNAFYSFIQKTTPDKSNTPIELFISPGDIFEKLNQIEWVINNRYKTYIEVISPFFDSSESQPVLQKLKEVFNPEEVVLFLPEDDSHILVEKSVYQSIESRGKEKVYWGKLPADLLKWVANNSKNDHGPKRYVHAKVIRILMAKENRVEKEIWIHGSANFTSAALLGNGGNYELSVIQMIENKHKPFINTARLLTRLNEKNNKECMVKTEEPKAAQIPDIRFAFDWEGHILYSVYFSSRETIDAGKYRFKIKATAGTPEINFTLQKVLTGDHGWHPIDLSLFASNIDTEKLFQNISVIYMIELASREEIPLLVQDLQPHRKPGIYSQLTPSQILELWTYYQSKETRNQKYEELLRKAMETGIGSAIYINQIIKTNLQTDSMFEQHAGLFHAFTSLDSELQGALSQKNFKLLEYRVIGNKEDSLPLYVDKILKESTKNDPVIVYLGLLSAIAILKKYKITLEKVSTKNREIIKKMERDWLNNKNELRQTFQDNMELNPDDFFNWYETEFMKG